MAFPAKSLLIFVALPVFTVCAATLYYYHMKDREWKRYLKKLEKYHEEMKVPLESVGNLIGRGGTNIKELQEKTNTHISFDNKFDNAASDNYRICKISGSKENVEAAKKLIVDTIYPKDIQIVEFWVADYICGRIIGRCGDNVRAITRASNAHVSVDRDKTTSDSRLVKIKGKPSEIAVAKSMIDEIIKECSQKNNQTRSPRSRAKNRKGNGVVINKAPQYERLVGSPKESMIQVYVSSVASPTHFWLQLISPRATELDHLVDDMTEFYNKEENRKTYKLKEAKKGQIVASKFQHDMKWYRVEVFSVEENKTDPSKSQVDVFYVDYGDSAFFSLEDLYELKPEYLHLKFQAIEACMAGIEPKGDQWEEAAIEVFEDMVYSAQWKVMLAQVVCHKEKQNSTRGGLIPFVRLYDPDGPQGVDIGSQLVEKGFATRVETDEPLSTNQDSDEEWVS